MSNLKQALFGIVCLAIIALPNVIFAQADKIYKDNNNSVVVILTYDEQNKPLSQGSGFIVRSDGAIVTNLHVVSGAVSIKVKITKDKYLKVEGILHIDKENDLVILKAKGENLSALNLGDSDKVKPGEKVYVIGSPAGLENTITDGIISGVREFNQNQQVIQISAPISQGSSGGPVFNEKGEVIAVATFMVKDAQNLNFAMPINIIKGKILKKKVMLLEKSVAEDYSSSAEYWYLQGLYYLIDGKDYQKAIKSYEQAIRIKPDYAKAYWGLGITYGELGNYKKALESYKQGIRIKPDNAGAHLLLGQTYGQLRNYSKAMESYKQSIRIKPDDAVAHSSLGLIYASLGDYEKAIKSYKQAIRIDPNDARAHCGLGLIYSNNDRSKALEEYKILKKLDKELANKLFDVIYADEK